MKEIARWSRDEVEALLQAWREGLEHQPNPLRRGKLNGYVSQRFHALRARFEPFRTACSIVYKKKYWKSMVQFICEYQEQSGDWFALAPAERKRCFGELKTTSYKFTDLEQDTAFEIAQLITLEDGTPGLADLVYVHSGGASSPASLRSGAAAHYRAYSPRTGAAWDVSPRPPSSLELGLLQSTHDRHRVGGGGEGGGTMHTGNSFLRHPYQDDASRSSSGDDNDYDNDNNDDDDDREFAGRHRRQPPSASSTPRSGILPPPRGFVNQPLLPASVSRYHEQQREVDEPLTPSSGSLFAAVARLEHETHQLTALVHHERDERRHARAQQAAQQQAWEAEQAQHQKLLTALHGRQRESSEASERAKQAQQDEWATILQQLQLDRQERLEAQNTRATDERERLALLEELRLSQLERQQATAAYATEQMERAAVLEQVRQERLVRNQENAQWRVLLAQLQAERADAAGGKQDNAREADGTNEGLKTEPKATESEPVAETTTGTTGKQVEAPEDVTRVATNPTNPTTTRVPGKRNRPAALTSAAEDENRGRGSRARRV